MPSRKYTKEELERLDVPYSLNDSCVDELADYITCKRYNQTLLESKLVYYLPFSGSYTVCGRLNTIWTKCQDKREREIFEQLAKIYKDSYKETLDQNMQRLGAVNYPGQPGTSQSK